MKNEDFDGELRIAEPYPRRYPTRFDLDDGESLLVPNGFWDTKAKLRTYN